MLCSDEVQLWARSGALDSLFLIAESLCHFFGDDRTQRLEKEAHVELERLIVS